MSHKIKSRRRIRYWTGTKGPFIYNPSAPAFVGGSFGAVGDVPFRIQESNDAGTFTSSRPPRRVATTSTETQIDEAEEQIASQNEVGNGPYQNYIAAHRWVPGLQSLSPAP